MRVSGWRAGRRPVIESSSRVRFGCFPGFGYTALKSQLEDSGLEPLVNPWAQIHEFKNPKRPSQGSFFSLLPADAQAALAAQFKSLPAAKELGADFCDDRLVPTTYGNGGAGRLHASLGATASLHLLVHTAAVPAGPLLDWVACMCQPGAAGTEAGAVVGVARTDIIAGGPKVVAGLKGAGVRAVPKQLGAPGAPLLAVEVLVGSLPADPAADETWLAGPLAGLKKLGATSWVVCRNPAATDFLYPSHQDQGSQFD